MSRVFITDILRQISEQTHVPLNVVKAVNAKLIDSIVENLKEGNVVKITNFGSFYVSVHRGHPIQFDNNRCEINDYKVLRFRASQTVKKGLNTSNEQKKTDAE